MRTYIITAYTGCKHRSSHGVEPTRQSLAECINILTDGNVSQRRVLEAVTCMNKLGVDANSVSVNGLYVDIWREGKAYAYTISC